MPLYPAPSPNRPDPVLQPSYFTSSIYVNSLRTDIDHLVSHFQPPASSPFAFFKELWSSQGWKWLHFRTLDDRSREAFLHVTCRLFIERTCANEPLLTRVAALFALYVFHSTQPGNTTPALWKLKNIPIPVDVHVDLYSTPQLLQEPAMRPVLLPVLFVLDHFARNEIFLILPSSTLSPQDPCSLPRELYVDQASVVTLDTKKKGRPSKNDKSRRVKARIAEMESWLNKTQASDATPSYSVTQDYARQKAELFRAMDDEDGHAALIDANDRVLHRLNEVDAMLVNDHQHVQPQDDTAGLQRVRNSVLEMQEGQGHGIFGLLEGSGLRT